MDKRVKKNSLLFLLILLVLIVFGGLYFFTENDNGEKKYVVGIINPNPGMAKTTKGFIKGMDDFGYIVKENVSYIKCEDGEKIDSALREMIDQKVDLIFTVTTPATKKAQVAVNGTDIPVIFAMHDPVSSGIIKSLVQPDGNLTGVQIRGSLTKAVEWLVLVDLGIRSIFVPIKFDTKAAQQSLSDLEHIAARLGIDLIVKELNSTNELELALSAMPSDIDAIFVLHSILIYSNLDKIVKAAVAAGIPTGSGSTLYEAGLTVTYGHNSYHMGKQVSHLANRVLQGKSATDTPAEIAEFFLGVNLQTAERSGVKVPNDVLLQADFIVR